MPVVADGLQPDPSSMVVEPPRSAPLRPGSWSAPFVVALAMTLLDAVKPPTVDDVCHFYFARQIASDPLHPYAFTIPWHQYVTPAWDVMVPPVMPYCWAPAIALFGDAPALWKLWFFPIFWLLAWALQRLFRRFARGIESPLMAMTALSPALLPGLNLMLEGAMFAFGLAGLAIFLRAVDRRRPGLAMLAGVLFGLAFQTKYSALAFAGPVVLYALAHGRLAILLATAAAAAAMAGAWEGFLALGHDGQSYFLHHLGRNNPLGKERAWVKILAMILHLGGLAPAVALVGMVGLGWRRSWILAGTALFAAGYALLAVLPSPLGGASGPPGVASGGFRPDTAIFLGMGAIALAVMAALSMRIGLSPLVRCVRGNPGSLARERLFLVAWLGSEILASYMMTPFVAARRVIGVVLAFTLLAGWAAARARPLAQSRRWIRGIAAGGIALGLLYQAVDRADCLAERTAAAESLAWIRGRDPRGTIWFTADHGSEFAAQQLGMRPFLRGASRLEPGDWLVIQQHLPEIWPQLLWYERDPGVMRLEQTIAPDDFLPLGTVTCYYLGRRPMEHRAGPRATAEIYRITAPFQPPYP